MAKFHHKFTPKRLAPAGDTVELSTQQIEDAGILEILQNPGAALGSWSVLDALLVPGQDWFVFHSPLGLSREVKTALSGLFGRFVARAYAKEYLGYSFFETIHSPPMSLSPTGGKVHRYPANGTGDLPDWVAWKPSGELAIVEAKGCNAANGLGTVLTRAYDQTKRATIRHGRRVATFKRYAIATRWGVDTIKSKPLLWVKDPVNDGSLSDEEQCQLGLGVVRRHYASLLRGLGYDELSRSMIALTESSRSAELPAKAQAEEILRGTPRRRLHSEAEREPQSELIGSVVLRSGPVRSFEDLTDEDLSALRKFFARPTFIGIEERNLRAAIEGDIENFSVRLPTEAKLSDRSGNLSLDSSGAWIGRLENPELHLTERLLE